MDWQKHFIEYRESLHTELQHLHSMITIIQDMENARTSKFAKLSPAFFYYSRFALGISVVIWASKLFTQTSEQKEVNVLKFIRFVKNSYKYLFAKPYTSESLQQSWSVTEDELRKHLAETETLVNFPELKTLRDKYYAHFDKKDFFDQSLLFQNNLVTLSELDKRAMRFHEILMNYSTAFDGPHLTLTVININDISRIIRLCEKNSG